MSFADLLQEKLGPHNPNEIEELILDELFTVSNSLSEEQKQVLQGYSSLIHLSMNSIGFATLDNFPALGNLQILELGSNKLDGKDLEKLGELFPQMYKIKLGNNQIEKLDAIKNLVKSSKALTKIELTGNPCCVPNYKENLFQEFEQLECIDKVDKEGNPIDSTIYDNDEEDEEDFEEDDVDDEEGEDDFDDEEIEEFDEDEDEDDEEEESEQPPKKHKKN